MKLLFISFWLIIFSVQAYSKNTPSINVAYLHANIIEQQLKVDSQVVFNFSERMYQAIKHDIPLTFDVQFRLVKNKRFLGINYRLTKERINYQIKIAYSNYNNKYFIYNKRTHNKQYFHTINDALLTFGTIRDFKITTTANLDPTAQYSIKFRLVLNKWQLPTQLIIEALTSRNWRLSNQWNSTLIL